MTDMKKSKLAIRIVAVILSCLMVLSGVAVVINFVLANSASGKAYTITYSAGQYLPAGSTDYTALTDTGLFEQFTLTQDGTLAGTLILPGETFIENLQGRTLNKNEAVLNGSHDLETYYFADTGETGYADDWAYTFTGWKIVGATDKIPGETVFQPGDVIRPDVLEKYATGANQDQIALEAVWGRCYFIRNPYENMVYQATQPVRYYTNQNQKEINIHIYALSLPNENATLPTSSVPTGASDDNTGNDPASPKATIDGLYASIREELDGVVTNVKNDPLVQDAYGRAVVLVGDLDYYTDSNQPMAKIYGYANEYVGAEGVAQANPTADKIIPLAATYKSFGDQTFTYNYKPRNYSNTVYGNLRFDNVNFCKKADSWSNEAANLAGKQDNGVEFQVADNSNITPEKSYIEFTARYNASMASGRNAAISTFRPADSTYVVVNGGKFGGMQNQYSSDVKTGKQLYWTVGRKASIDNLNCGTTTAYSTSYTNVYYNYNVYILGGVISNVYGGNNGLNTIGIGKRNFFLYGDGETGGNQTEYDPKISNFYGGSSEARLYGDISIEANGCWQLKNLYGGGKSYSATTYGNIKISLKDCLLTGNVYGGGEYGNCERTPEEYIQYETKTDSVTQEKIPVGTSKPLSELDAKIPGISIDGRNLQQRHTAQIGGDVTILLDNTQVNGNIFGSGMGQSQILEVRSQMQATEDKWWGNREMDDPITKEDNVAPNEDPNWLAGPIEGYPSYSDEDHRVIVNAWRDNTYTTTAIGIMSYYNFSAYASLSLATVQNVTISISNGSQIGTTTNSHTSGNVYGGGSIAKVLGNTSITIENSVVYGDVFGGGDGVTTPSKIRVYWPENHEIYQEGGALYDPALPEYQSPYYTGVIGEITLHKQEPSPDNRKNDNQANAGKYKQYIEYTWSNDLSLLSDPDSESYGMDHENKLLYSPNTEGLGAVMGNTTVTVTGDQTHLHGNVFGGGNEAFVGGTTTVDVEGGSVNTVFGGGNAADVKGNVTLNLKGGSVDYAFGGNNMKGMINGQIAVNLNGATVNQQLFGGGNEADYGDVPELNISSGKVGDIDSEQNAGQTVTGTAYGGGKKAEVLGTNVTVTGGELRSLFGGSYQANIGANGVKVSIDGTVVGEGANAKPSTVIRTFVGANDQSGVINGPIDITVGTDGGDNDGISITNFFGGGNKALYSYGEDWTPSVTRENYTDDPDPSFKGVTINIHSGTIYQAFGGGVMARVENARMYVHGGQFHFLYGGGYQGDVDYTVVHLYGGNVAGDMLPEGLTTPPAANHGGYVFGGGYEGKVSTSASVHLEDKSTDPAVPKLYVQHSVFGGGNKASTQETNVVIKNGKVQGSIYGGGFEGEADSTNVMLSGGNLGAGTNIDGKFYNGNVYGGGYSGNTKTTHVDIVELHHNHQVDLILGGNVYGGGHKANVEEAYVHFLAGEITKDLYGGGREGHAQTTYVDILAGTVGGSVYGGGYMGEVQDTHVLVSDKAEIIQDTDTTLYNSYQDVVRYIAVNGLDSDQLLIEIKGNVFGGGHGTAATVWNTTTVVINTEFTFTANETADDTQHQYPSEQIKTTITPQSASYSKITGNVYGGGDYGRVGDGIINQSNNTAQVTKVGSTSVTLNGGYIGGSVFGGGNGVPTDDMAYNVYMGTVFGRTEVNIYNGLVEGNLYGGGTQARVFGTGANALAAHLVIEERKDEKDKIAIGGSVFGGGDRGSGATTNASIPTTVGDVKVEILNHSGNASSQIYFYKAGDTNGGVYGEGNLCLVRGRREVVLENFTIEGVGKLKTFYSLQRADVVTLINSDIVLLGAVDLVEEGDTTVYSINRVGNLKLTRGSTVKLTAIVKGLGGLESDIETDRVFIDKGNNGINSYIDHGGSYPNDMLNSDEIDAYRGETMTISESDSISDEDKNTVCVANGLYLEVRNVDAERTYGPVKGLFTLELLHATPGEGGGFVYGQIDGSTGDFICETVRGMEYTLQEGLTQDQFNAGTYYIRRPGGYYEEAQTYDSRELYYLGVMSNVYMDVVDEVTRKQSGVYTCYMWYINGPTIRYDTVVTGYIGSSDTAFPTEKQIPRHEDDNLYYTLYGIDGGTALIDKITGANSTYDLVQTKESLQGQQIALELKLGNTSIGFLFYDDATGKWGIKLTKTQQTIYGYNGVTSQAHLNNILDDGNDATEDTFESDTESGIVTVILHKSTDVNTETLDMSGLIIEFSIFDTNETHAWGPYADGTSTLVFDTTAHIKRLVPTQSLYASPEKNYIGADGLQQINITAHSSFTADYTTRYIASAYSKQSGSMTWKLYTESYLYAFNEASGLYFTLDKAGNWVNGYSNLNYDLSRLDIPSENPEPNRIYLDNGVYKVYTDIDGTGIDWITFDVTPRVTSTFPKNTKIVMIDYSILEQPQYFYYICPQNMTEIDLMNFMYMGTNQTIRDAMTQGTVPPFVRNYDEQQSARVTERLLFTFDFSQTTPTRTGTVPENGTNIPVFAGVINLGHIYTPSANPDKGVDIMDFVEKTTQGQSIRRRPLLVDYQLNLSTEEGLDKYEVAFGDVSYYDCGSAQLNVSFSEATDWINTQFHEGDFSLMIELLDQNGIPMEFPIGMNFLYKSSGYVPGDGRKHVIIPVSSTGDHTITIENALYSLKEYLGTDRATFRVTLYSSPDSRYYDHFTTTRKQTVAYTILDDPTYALKVTQDGTQLLSAGNDFNFKVETKASNGAPAQALAVKVLKYENSSYTDVEWTDVFETAAPEAAGSYSLQTKTGAEGGTYRLVFTYGGHVEYLNLIIA